MVLKILSQDLVNWRCFSVLLFRVYVFVSGMILLQELGVLKIVSQELCAQVSISDICEGKALAYY